MTPDPSDEQSSGGNLQPTSAGQLVGWGVAGLVGGWLLHPLAERLRGTAPIVTWTQVLALVLLGAILGGTAWLTWRSLQVRGERIQSHLAVNRLVLARASALVGALVAGGYLGYAVSWLGIDTELAAQRVWRSLAAAAAGIAVTITAILLERACRIRSGPDES